MRAFFVQNVPPLDPLSTRWLISARRRLSRCPAAFLLHVQGGTERVGLVLSLRSGASTELGAMEIVGPGLPSGSTGAGAVAHDHQNAGEKHSP